MSNPWLVMQSAQLHHDELLVEAGKRRRAAEARRGGGPHRHSGLRAWAGVRIVRVGLAVGGTDPFDNRLPIGHLA